MEKLNLDLIRKRFIQIYKEENTDVIRESWRMIFFDQVIDYMEYSGDEFGNEVVIQVQTQTERFCLKTSLDNFQKLHDKYLDYSSKMSNFVQN